MYEIAGFEFNDGLLAEAPDIHLNRDGGMYRRSDWIELAFLGLGFVLMFAGTRLSLPVLTALGGASIGFFALVGGIAALKTKRLGFETRQPNFGRREMYTGLAAQLWGVLFIAFALLVFLLDGIAWFSPHGAEAFWADFLGRPWGWGILALCIGLTTLVSGIIQLVAGSAGYYQGWADRVQRIGAVIPLLFGLGLSTIGVLLIVIPGVVLGATHGLMILLERWRFH